MLSPFYADKTVAIYHGDCREILPAIGVRADVMITDPPYDDATHEGARSQEVSRRQGITFDPVDPAWVAPLLVEFTARWVLAFCSLQQLGAYQAAAGEAWVRAGTWHKITGAPQFTGDRPAQGCDGIAILHRPGKNLKHWNGGGTQAHYAFTVERGKDRRHPTQKPEALMSELVGLYSDPGELVIDPFMGSGTTLVAAKRFGRRAIGIELDERWCEEAARRLSQGVLNLFETVNG